MSQIVHITFEKLTGLKGEIEGWFMCDPKKIDISIPLVYRCNSIIIGKGALQFIFSQCNYYVGLEAVGGDINNYLEHFKYGTNFLIKSWSYGGGVTINSQPPN